MLTLEFSINKYFLPSVENMVSKVAKKAKDLGDVTLTVGDPYRIKIESAVWWDSEYVYETWVDGTLTYPDLTLGEWDVIGICERLEDKNILTGSDELSVYRHQHLGCEHCNTNRMRKKFVFVKNRSTGEIKCVGRSCLSEYVGYDPAIVLSLIDKWGRIKANLEAPDEYWDVDDKVKQASLQIPVDRLVALTVWEVRQNGFLSVSQAYNTGGLSTSEALKSLMFTAKLSDDTQKDGPNDSDIAFAKDIVNDWKTVDINSCNDFLFKLNAAAEVGYIYMNLFGVVVAGAAIAFLKSQEIQTDKPVDGFLGNNGERKELTIKITTSQVKRGLTGSDYVLIKGLTECNHEVVYMGYSKFAEEAELGKVYRVKATVTHKSHARYGKSNVISRVTIKETL